MYEIATSRQVAVASEWPTVEDRHVERSGVNSYFFRAASEFTTTFSGGEAIALPAPLVATRAAPARRHRWLRGSFKWGSAVRIVETGGLSLE